MTTPSPNLEPHGPGTRLWRDVLAFAEPETPSEWVLLEKACKTLDELDRIERALSCAAVLVDGSKGQKIANPLFGEARQHRATLRLLLEALGLKGDAVSPGLAKSSAGRKLALLRHHGAAS